MLHQLPLSYSRSGELRPAWCARRVAARRCHCGKRQLMRRRCRTPNFAAGRVKAERLSGSPDLANRPYRFFPPPKFRTD
jgi:hypothetical protein